MGVDRRGPCEEGKTGQRAWANGGKTRLDAGGDLDHRSCGDIGRELHGDVRRGAEAAVRMGDRVVFVPVRDRKGSGEDDQGNAQQGQQQAPPVLPCLACLRTNHSPSIVRGWGN